MNTVVLNLLEKVVYICGGESGNGARNVNEVPRGWQSEKEQRQRSQRELLNWKKKSTKVWA